MNPARRLLAASPGAELWPLALLGLGGLVAYANSLGGPFVFDDLPAITENASIRQLSSALIPPDNGSAVVGRPLINLSFAINRAIGGYEPARYHVANLFIHLFAGLTLYGIVRRTLTRDPVRMSAAAARTTATGAALWWLVHPLQTESVTCVVQRTESLMGLFFLLTFYAFIRATEAPAVRTWPTLAVVACVAGMACKEVMVAAPVLVFFYDRCFVGGSFAAAWKQRRGLHLALAATWILLAWLVIGSGANRGGTSGFAVSTTTWWQYALTQCDAITRYVGLSFWPHPLVVDYGTSVVGRVMDVWPQAACVLGLVVLGLVALVRWPAWGFLAAWFFAILAPSSSVIPLATQTIAEHRMYLPLAAITTALAIGCHTLLGRRNMIAFLGVAVAFTTLTWRRNQDYQSALALWADTVSKAPENARAHNQLGRALHDAGREDEAFACYQESLRLNPVVPETHYSLGLILENRGQPGEAEQRYREAIRYQADFAPARLNLGALLIAVRRLDEARAFLEETTRLLPANAQAHINLGVALIESHRASDAISPLQTAVLLAPDEPKAHGNLANALALSGRLTDAMPHYEAALRFDPGYIIAHDNFGLVLLELGRLEEAAVQFEAALRLDPENPVRRERLEEVRQKIGRAGGR